MQNQINPDEVEEELQEAEEALQKERNSFQADIADFQDLLARGEKAEEEEAKLLQAEQDELAAQEQQLLNAVEEKDEDENEKMRQSLSELLEVNTPRKESVSLSEDAVPPSLTNEQLQAEFGPCSEAQTRGARTVGE